MINGTSNTSVPYGIAIQTKNCTVLRLIFLLNTIDQRSVVGDIVRYQIFRLYYKSEDNCLYASLTMSNTAKTTSMKDVEESEPTNAIKICIQNRKTGEFLPRKSLLTDLFQVPHINCVRNAFIAGFILMVFRQLIYDLLNYGRPNWTFELLSSTVGKLHIAMFAWLVMMFLTSIIVFYGTYLWIVNRKIAGIYLRFYDITCMWIYVFYIVGLLVVPCWLIMKHQLPIVSAAIVLGEQLRFLMKTHSFVRENVVQILPESTNSTDQLLPLQLNHFNRYLYFLFAPTLLYRSDYPRTSVIQWNIVMEMFGQFLIIVFLIYHIIANFWLPIFAHVFTNDDVTLELTITTIFGLMLPGALIIVLAFYGFFHCWLNAFAELLRFADRMFYEDWWNFTSATTFWRSWNAVVHDWLFVYVYRDLSKLFRENRKMSAACVVLLSALFHEYFMTITLGFFSPILLIWFGLFGMLFRFAFPRAKGMQWNIALLTFLPISGGVIPYLYALEVSARSYPLKRKTFWSFMFNSNQLSNQEL